MIRVLHVEDDHTCRTLLPMALGAPEFSMRCCSSVGDMLAILDVETFDALIIDLNLPDSPHDQTVGTLIEVRKWFPGAIIISSAHLDASLAAVRYIDGFLAKEGFSDARDVVTAAIARRERGRAIGGSPA